MIKAGPELEPLLHRLAECPPEFLQVGPRNEAGGVVVLAIVCDLLRTIDPTKPPEMESKLHAEIQTRSEVQLTLISIACWLLSDEWFLGKPHFAPRVRELFVSDQLAQLADLIRPEKFVSDSDRREELVRVCLNRLNLRPQGETDAQAADRLAALDTVERDQVLRATAIAERRAREVREAMARTRAQESASRYGE